MRARFTSLKQWEAPGDYSDVDLPDGGFLDLHNDFGLLGVAMLGYPKSTVRLEFGHPARGRFALEFHDVGELVMQQTVTSSDGWHGQPDDEPEGIDSITYYEYGAELPPVFEVQAPSLRLKFRAWEVALRPLAA
ncbi:hypothetical protein ABZW10_24020 [Kitasatospora sp. NPDC004723]|uniref:hypothetical protein n=1 Tax=Kitasatospora sp. NPDC004723 TaxID=3154288 RepID=UPI0033BEBF6F